MPQVGSQKAVSNPSISAIKRYTSQKTHRMIGPECQSMRCIYGVSPYFCLNFWTLLQLYCHLEAVRSLIIVSGKWFFPLRLCLLCISDASKSSLFSLARILKPDPCNDDIPRFWRDQGIYTRCLRALYHIFASYLTFDTCSVSSTSTSSALRQDARLQRKEIPIWPLQPQRPSHPYCRFYVR